ncbi:CDP-glycerol glycerophosphotransferase family protein [Vibrio sp. Hep-1b-8]|uniref:CDP-glycerol glycerophosphotransferase family protein n=1 Tax=Vibrio sp. Hep-1b-8 TaxID=2144187 RepID=UPI0014865F41|nr:CDP-glycerol glycerophosphotransferase family protein [Vibrio sp. Hep-1b-8]
MLEENISKLKKIYYYLNKYNITYHYAPTSFVSNILSRMFGCKKNKFVIASQPRTDYLSSLDLNYSNNRNSKFNVLYAPTWRNNSRNFFEMFKLEEIKKFKDKLDKIGVSFTYRPHPLFDFPDEIKNTLNISTKECEPEICDFLSSYDLLVTDYSSISIDYLILDKPIIIFNYDYDIYSIDNGFCFDFEEYNPGEKVKDLDELYQSIFNNIKDKDKFKDNRRTLHNLINGEYKNSSEIFIRDILNDK